MPNQIQVICNTDLKVLPLDSTLFSFNNSEPYTKEYDQGIIAKLKINTSSTQFYDFATKYSINKIVNSGIQILKDGRCYLEDNAVKFFANVSKTINARYHFDYNSFLRNLFKEDLLNLEAISTLSLALEKLANENHFTNSDIRGTVEAYSNLKNDLFSSTKLLLKKIINKMPKIYLDAEDLVIDSYVTEGHIKRNLLNEIIAKGNTQDKGYSSKIVNLLSSYLKSRNNRHVAQAYAIIKHLDKESGLTKQVITNLKLHNKYLMKLFALSLLDNNDYLAKLCRDKLNIIFDQDEIEIHGIYQVSRGLYDLIANDKDFWNIFSYPEIAKDKLFTNFLRNLPQVLDLIQLMEYSKLDNRVMQGIIDRFSLDKINCVGDNSKKSECNYITPLLCNIRNRPYFGHPFIFWKYKDKVSKLVELLETHYYSKNSDSKRSYHHKFRNRNSYHRFSRTKNIFYEAMYNTGEFISIAFTSFILPLCVIDILLKLINKVLFISTSKSNAKEDFMDKFYRLDEHRQCIALLIFMDILSRIDGNREDPKATESIHSLCQLLKDLCLIQSNYALENLVNGRHDKAAVAKVIKLMQPEKLIEYKNLIERTLVNVGEGKLLAKIVDIMLAKGLKNMPTYSKEWLDKNLSLFTESIINEIAEANITKPIHEKTLIFRQDSYLTPNNLPEKHTNKVKIPEYKVH